MRRLIRSAAAIAASLIIIQGASAQERSRAFLTGSTQEVIQDLRNGAGPVVRNPDDGDDILSENDVAAVKAVHTYGALGRTTANSIGLAPGSILIRTSERKLYYGIDDRTMRVYPVAVGKSGAQWRGDASIGRKAVNPVWRPTARQRRLKHVPAVVRAGPSNPLGVRALYLRRGGRETLYRIHGTNAPRSIGRAVSSGCIRMRNADVIDLYGRVGVGTPVQVR